MLWMLEQNLQLQKIALCLDNDDAGRKAIDRLIGILAERGYTQTVPLLPERKDWNDMLTASADEQEQGLTMKMG
ncbi:MAG: toprim domain-containing protein [Oscillospiraceae bacterium]|nr:toprim domain-containing protein [Oscillospiraceae bacterium]